MEAFVHARLQRLNRFGSEHAVFRKAWFLPLHYAGHIIAAAKRQFLQKKNGEKIV